MSLSFFERLETRARQSGSLLCIGLDPHPADLAETNAQSARDACLRLIEATHDLALAYKPNAAFFEVFGPEGWTVLKEIILFARHSIRAHTSDTNSLNQCTANPFPEFVA